MLMKVFYRLSACFICVTTLVFSSGCMSFRYTTNIRPPADPAASIPKGYTFSIQRVNYYRDGSKLAASAPQNVRSENMSDTTAEAYLWNNEKWRRELVTTALKRYPMIFSSGPDAYPLSVAIHMKARASIVPSIALELLTLTLAPVIFPLPVREVCDIQVLPELMLDDSAGMVPLSTVAFQRRDVMWLSATPLALIPVPGPSDRRETMVLSLNPEAPSVPVKGLALSVEGCVDAIVHSLQASGPDVKRVLVGRGLDEGLVVP